VCSPIGIHLEGPFLSHIKRGVHPPEKLREPSIELFDRFFEAAGGHVKLMTLAPELPGANETGRDMQCERGVRISMGHSNATAAETRKTNRRGRDRSARTPSMRCARWINASPAFWAWC